MQKLEYTVKRFMCCILLLCAVVLAGVVCIAFGATNGKIALWIVGAIVVAAGIGVLPVMWQKVQKLKKQKFVLKLVQEESILSLAQLAEETGYTNEQMEKTVGQLLKDNYLTGYTLQQGTLVAND